MKITIEFDLKDEKDGVMFLKTISGFAELDKEKVKD